MKKHINRLLPILLAVLMLVLPAIGEGLFIPSNLEFGMPVTKESTYLVYKEDEVEVYVTKTELYGDNCASLLLYTDNRLTDILTHIYVEDPREANALYNDLIAEYAKRYQIIDMSPEKHIFAQANIRFVTLYIQEIPRVLIYATDTNVGNVEKRMATIFADAGDIAINKTYFGGTEYNEPMQGSRTKYSQSKSSFKNILFGCN